MPHPIRRTFGFLALVTFFGAGPMAPMALAQECEFLQEDGTERACTFTERYGQCLFNALQSYADCVEEADNILQRGVCEVAVQIDLAACTLGLAGEILALVTPF